MKVILKTLNGKEYILNIEEKENGKTLYEKVLETPSFNGFFPFSNSCYKIKLVCEGKKIFCNLSLSEQGISEGIVIYAIIPMLSGIVPCECIRREIEPTCCICFEEKEKDKMCLLNVCSHYFCLECSMNIFNNGEHICFQSIKCPLCRTKNDCIFSSDTTENLTQKLCLKCYE